MNTLRARGVRGFISVSILLLFAFGQVAGLAAETENQNQDVPADVSKIMSDQARYDQMQTRREMLGWHQWAGIAAWGLWLATNLSGEQALHNLRRTNDPLIQYFILTAPQNANPLPNLALATALRDNSRWHSPGSDAHVGLAIATFATYGLAAGLAFFSPDRFEETERGEFDSIFFHKALAFVHLAAMLALPFLAEGPEERGPAGAQAMRAVGWTGFGALTVSVAVFYF